MQPDLFGFSAGARAFNPRPVPAGHLRMIGRCSRKKCKFCKAFDIPLGTCHDWKGRPYQGADPKAITLARAHTKCPTHPDAWLTLETVQGTKSDSFVCDARCTSATGKVCICSCGGANHGSAWLA